MTSCNKLLIEKDPENDPMTNFESLWTTVNQKYSYFEEKNVNWDSIGEVYRPQVTRNTSDTALFRILSDMLYHLKDGHTNLYSNFDVSRNWSWYLDYEPNFNWDVIQRNYLKEDHLITGGFRHTELNDSIAYIYYGSFMSLIFNDQLKFITERYEDHSGIIIDVRDNGGGLVMNAHRLAGLLIDEPMTGYYEYLKMSEGEDGFVGPIEQIVEPDDSFRFEQRVVVLTNRSSYSATNIFSAIVRGTDRVTVMGDFSGGGGGMPSDNQLPNGWIYRFSTTRTEDRFGNDIEGGVPPNYLVETTADDASQGRDNIIDAGILYLQTPVDSL